LSKAPAEIKSKAPELGEHTDVLLEELGYSAEHIVAMKESGIVG
jgi:crotonobetainyl-CoA:carnitine CoA-transferase CaiB-like acyl-CoA transferase